MSLVEKILYVFIGSGLGGACRFLIAHYLNYHQPFPLHTLLINALACFAMGFFFNVLTKNSLLHFFLITGFCGGFSTFSSFTNEILHIPLFYAALYIFASLFLGLLMNLMGLKFAQYFF